eukprot:2394273-Lingulodinium_polyedra.AAC.1
MQPAPHGLLVQHVSVQWTNLHEHLSQLPAGAAAGRVRRLCRGRRGNGRHERLQGVLLGLLLGPACGASA